MIKKQLKTSLIIGGFIAILGGTRILLSKKGIVPSRCNIKCMIGCGCINCPIVMGRSCSNDCDIKCEIPKYEKCISKCNKPNVEGYDEKSYDLWYTKGRGSRGYAYYGDYDVVLINNDGYEEWIDENFSGYQEELKEYESCKSTCGKAPSYGLFN